MKIPLLKIDKAEKFLFFCLCGFAFSLPVSKAAGNLFLALSLLLFFYRIYLKHDDIEKNFYANKNIFAVIGFLFGTVLISAFTSSDILSGVKSWLDKYFFHASIILPIIFLTYDREKIFLLFKLLFAGCLITYFAVIVQALANISVEGYQRFGGLHTLMTQASLLVMTLPILLLMFLHTQEKRFKIFFAILFFVGVAALLLNGTRGAWIAAIILLPLTASIYSGYKKKSLAVILGILILFGGFFSMSSTLSNRLSTVTDLKMQSNSERLLMWESAFNMFKDHPIFGIGYGQYGTAYKTKYISPDAKEYWQVHAHNNFIQMLAECGILGFSAFVFMWIYFSYWALKNWRRKKNISYLMFFCTLWGMILHGFTEFNFETSITGKLFWFSLALCIAYERTSRKNFLH